MSGGFGFKKRSEAATLGAADLAKQVRRVDISDEMEEKAIRAGEEKGFVQRTAMDEGGSADRRTSRRRRASVPRGKLLVTGPQEVLDRFIRYTDDNDFPSYWKAMESLLDR